MSKTVGNVIKSLFPEGTQPGGEIFLEHVDPGIAENPNAAWLFPPMLPSDVFAVAGHICKIASLVGHLDPHIEARDGPGFQILSDERQLLLECGASWGSSSKAYSPEKETEVLPELVFQLWDEIIQCWDERIVLLRSVSNEPGSTEPRWARAAISLFIISDTAFSRTYFDLKSNRKENLMADWVSIHRLRMMTELPSGNQAVDDSGHSPLIEMGDPPSSITMMANTALATVLPKVRVPNVGAGLRNLSRNLALLPGSSELKLSYEPQIDADVKPRLESVTNGKPLNLLLVPFPFHIDSRAFEPASGREKLPADRDWDSFRIRQHWIDTAQKREDFLASVSRMLIEAKKEVDEVHGMILPELSIDYELFIKLGDRFKDSCPEAEMFVAGLTTDIHNENGNFLATREWGITCDLTRIHIRSKQQRWKLDLAQLETYGLTSLVDATTKYWWEDAHIGNRRLSFHSLREDTVFTSLICEELARSDACHDALRAVGPNIIFALLMDSAQIPERWPGSYATALADDPGSSVLSLTSAGLVRRSVRMRGSGSNSIALWKDETGLTKTFELPEHEGAVLLSLRPQKVTDRTILDMPSQVTSWRYFAHRNIVA